VFSYYRGWKEACQATRAISTTCRRELLSSFFFLQGKAPKEIHAILKETLGDYAPSYATVKNWVAQLKRGDFSFCYALRPGRPKTVTTPEIINQIHELILEDRRISAKPIAEQWASYVSGLDPPFMKIWTCGSSPRSGSRNAWTRIKKSTVPVVWANWEFFQHDPNDFLSRLVTMDETWLYHYDPETNQQSMEWRHSGSPRPKKFRVQKSAGTILASILGIKTPSSALIPFQRAKLSTQSIAYLCWCNWRTFCRKTAAGRSARGSCSCTTMPRLTEHMKPRRNWPTWASNDLITHPILRIWPRRTTTCSLDWKKKHLKGSHFSSDAVIAAAETRLDGRPSEFFFLSGLQKLEQRAEKYIELRGEYVE